MPQGRCCCWASSVTKHQTSTISRRVSSWVHVAAQKRQSKGKYRKHLRHTDSSTHLPASKPEPRSWLRTDPAVWRPCHCRGSWPLPTNRPTLGRGFVTALRKTGLERPPFSRACAFRVCPCVCACVHARVHVLVFVNVQVYADVQCIAVVATLCSGLVLFGRGCNTPGPCGRLLRPFVPETEEADYK